MLASKALAMTETPSSGWCFDRISMREPSANSAIADSTCARRRTTEANLELIGDSYHVHRIVGGLPGLTVGNPSRSGGKVPRPEPTSRAHHHF